MTYSVTTRALLLYTLGVVTEYKSCCSMSCHLFLVLGLDSAASCSTQSSVLAAESPKTQE